MPTFDLALEQFNAGQFQTALDSWNQILQAQPDYAEAYYYRGRTRAKLGDAYGAIADYTMAIQIRPTAEAYLNRAFSFVQTSDRPGAIADAQQAMNLDAQLALAPHLLGTLYTQNQQRPEAIAAYKQAAHRYLALGDKAAAQDCIAQIEALQPNAVPTHSSPPIPVDPQASNRFLIEATQKFQQGKMAAALQDLEWLLQLEPNHPEALCLFAKIQAQRGNGQVAISAIARALQSNPEDPYLRSQRSKVRLLLGDAQGAIAELTQLIQQDPSNPKLYVQRGEAYVQLEQLDAAFKDAANAIGIAPDQPEGYELRAIVQRESQDWEAAVEDYQLAASRWLDRGNWENQQIALSAAKALKLEIKRQQDAKSAASVIRVPIKYFYGGTPVIEVIFNERYTFDMIVDTGASMTVISPRMAEILRVQVTGSLWGQLADGRSVELGTGEVRSLRVGSAQMDDVPVAIAPQDVEGLLGQTFLSHYHVHILSNEIELRRK